MLADYGGKYLWKKVSFEPGTNSECVMEGKNHKQILSRTKTRNGQPFWLSFAPILRNESSKERKFQGAKVPHLELSLPGANGLGSEKSSYHIVSPQAQLVSKQLLIGILFHKTFQTSIMRSGC